MRIVVDCANGAAYKVAPEALWELGAEVVAIGVEPDGFNINRDAGSTAPGALVKKVREVRADIGIALDGDADRVLIVDEAGKLVDGDQLMAAIAQSWQEDGRLARPGIVATLMSNLGLERYLEGIGLSLMRTAVGDRYVLEYMRRDRDLISAASSPATLSSWIIARPATDSLPPCRSLRLSRAKINR